MEINSINLEQNTEKIVALNGRHDGETIFIIGAAPSFGKLSFGELTALKKKTTIGLNRVFYKLNKLTYFMSAYFTEVLLAQKYLPAESVLLHHRLVYEPPLGPGVLTLRREHFPDDGTSLPMHLEGPFPFVFTKKNAAFAATHFAAILGAKKIVYVGLEQRNGLHYYDDNLKIKEQVVHDLHEIYTKSNFPKDHPTDSLEGQMNLLNTPYEQLCSKEYFSRGEHVFFFRKFFEILGQNGVEFYSTVEDSIVVDAGAKYVTMTDLL